MSKKFYIGENTKVPIYEETQTPLEGLDYLNYNTLYFSTTSYGNGIVRSSSTTNGVAGFRFGANNIGKDSSTGGMAFTALADLKNVKVYCEYKTEKSWDKVTTIIAGETVMNEVSGTDNTALNLIWSGDLAAGEKIDCKYSKDSSQSASGEKVYWEITCDPLTETTIEIVGYENKDVAQQINKLYWPIWGQYPVYDRTYTELEPLNLNNYRSTYFEMSFSGASITSAATVMTGNGFRVGYGETPGSSADTLVITLVSKHDLKNVKIYCEYKTYTGYDKVSVSVGSVLVLNKVSGEQLVPTLIWSGDIAAGQTIRYEYSKQSSGLTTERVYWDLLCDPAVEVTTNFIGYEEGYVARKIKKAYFGVDNIARCVFSNGEIIYTGDYTVSGIEVEGKKYNLYTITSSGTLVISDSIQYWMCGGGASPSSATRYGSTSTYNYTYGSFGGNGGRINSGILAPGNYVITIGSGGVYNASGGDTLISIANGENIATALGGPLSTSGVGGSGGGGRGQINHTAETITASSRAGQAGEGISTIPFGIEELYEHCAGGGGGLALVTSSNGTNYYAKAGSGGSNGANGNSSSSSLATSWNNAAGGTYGGGQGGGRTGGGGDATFYGGGGGGGSAYYSLVDSTGGTYSPGDGYQGVFYLLIPV